MKKILIGIFLIALLVLPLTVSADSLSLNSKEAETSSLEDFTHTPFVEYCSMTTCGPCVIASSQLYSIYQAGDLDFNYVTLVWDAAGARVRGRLQELGVTSVPDVFFDGKYKHIIGSQSSEQNYRDAITLAGNRDVPDFDIGMDVIWQGGGNIKIVVAVKNNEPIDYSGRIRVYIVEKESRWNDNGGNPYHYAALDVALDRTLTFTREQIRPLGDTYGYTINWVGSLFGFSDITQDNIVVIASVFDKDTDYVIESAIGEPSASSNSHRLLSRFLPNILEKIMERFSLFERLISLKR